MALLEYIFESLQGVGKVLLEGKERVMSFTFDLCLP